MTDFALDLRYFRFVVAAVEFGSLRQAAIALDISQSTVSRRIQSLEYGLGFSLFDRDRKGTRLTPAGERFLKDAVLGMKQLERAAQMASATHKGDRGELKLGILALLSSGHLNSALREFRERHPNIRLIVHEGTAQENIHRLTLGILDVVIIVGDSDLPGLVSEHLWKERVYVALPENHKLAARTELRWTDVREETFIVDGSGPGPDMQLYLVKRLGDVGFQPVIDVHDVSRESLMHLVAMGYGLTLTGSSALSASTKEVVFRRLAEEGEELSSNAIWSSNNQNPARKLFLKLTKNLVEDFMRKAVWGVVGVFVAVAPCEVFKDFDDRGAPAQIRGQYR